MSRLGGYYMIPPGMRCAGTCRSAWTGGSSSSRTCAGSMEWKDEETTGGEREKKKAELGDGEVTSWSRPCG
jgi:hypothetical protein